MEDDIKLEPGKKYNLFDLQKKMNKELDVVT